MMTKRFFVFKQQKSKQKTYTLLMKLWILRILFPKFESRSTIPATPFIVTLIHCEQFQFQNQNYLQWNNIAMDTRIILSYTSLFFIQDKFLKDFLIKNQWLILLVWFRFIDNIFIIWRHGIKKVDTFFSILTKFWIAVKLTILFYKTTFFYVLY